MSDCSPITYQEGLECAMDIGAVKYMECSALTNRCVRLGRSAKASFIPRTNVFLLCFALDAPSSANVKEQRYPELITTAHKQGLECARDISAVYYMECSSLSEKEVQKVLLEGAKAAAVF